MIQHILLLMVATAVGWFFGKLAAYLSPFGFEVRRLRAEVRERRETLKLMKQLAEEQNQRRGEPSE